MSSKCVSADFHQPSALYIDINIFTSSILSLQCNIERNITSSLGVCQQVSNNSINSTLYYIGKRCVITLLTILFTVYLTLTALVPKVMAALFLSGQTRDITNDYLPNLYPIEQNESFDTNNK
ncbi:hypothetical protein CSV63_11820 [Sporosarcina sp. P34]|nr:hypothetical protein CSV63_11820 [Sporosarcina sp. P34]